MNLKLLDDIYKTFIDMKPSVYTLGYLAGIQAVTFALYLTYKYLNNQSSDEPELKQEQEQEEQEREHDVQMEDVNQEVDLPKSEKPQEELYDLLTSKREELDNLINQLSYIQENIVNIRNKLEDLNKRPEK